MFSIVLSRVAAISALLVAATLHAEVRYNVIDLGAPGGSGSESYAYGINDAGQVVGYYSSASGGYHEIAFRTQPLSPISPFDNLGTLGGSSGRALGINNLGQVTGYSGLADGYNHAFRTAPNGTINPATDDLGTLGGLASEGHGINDLGQVTGWAMTPTNTFRAAFRTAPNAPINAGTDNLHPAGAINSEAEAINNVGQVIGVVSTAPLSGYAFRHAGAGPINPATDNLGSLANMGTSAMAINDAGEVTGSSGVPGPVNLSHAYRTAPNAAIQPGDDLTSSSLDSAIGWGINDDGDVVGWRGGRAFIYTEGQLFDLNSLIGVPQWTLVEARDINNLGQIVGYGQFSGGLPRAFLLTPVPEPGVISIVCIGGIALMRRRRRTD